MTQKRPRTHAQLVGEILAEALRRARPVIPQPDKAPQQIERLSRRMRRRRRDSEPAEGAPPGPKESFGEFLQRIDEEAVRDEERARWKAEAERLRRERDHTDEKEGGR